MGVIDKYENKWLGMACTYGIGAREEDENHRKRERERERERDVKLHYLRSRNVAVCR